MSRAGADPLPAWAERLSAGVRGAIFSAFRRAARAGAVRAEDVATLASVHCRYVAASLLTPEPDRSHHRRAVEILRADRRAVVAWLKENGRQALTRD